MRDEFAAEVRWFQRKIETDSDAEWTFKYQQDLFRCLVRLVDEVRCRRVLETLRPVFFHTTLCFFDGDSDIDEFARVAALDADTLRLWLVEVELSLYTDPFTLTDPAQRTYAAPKDGAVVVEGTVPQVCDALEQVSERYQNTKHERHRLEVQMINREKRRDERSRALGESDPFEE